MEMMIQFLVIFLIFTLLASGEEISIDNDPIDSSKFMSLIEWREELDIQDYGPDFDEILHSEILDLFRMCEAIVVYEVDGMGLSDIISRSHLCISGHKIVKACRVLEINDMEVGNSELLQKSLLKFLEYSNYGDRFLTVFQPSRAVEILSKDSSLVLLCDVKNKMYAFGESSGGGEDGTWKSEVFTLSSELDIFMDICKVFESCE